MQDAPDLLLVLPMRILSEFAIFLNNFQTPHLNLSIEIVKVNEQQKNSLCAKKRKTLKIEFQIVVIYNQQDTIKNKLKFKEKESLKKQQEFMLFLLFSKCDC